jgi:glycosyltransferase involved in cell wall biosynthesis
LPTGEVRFTPLPGTLYFARTGDDVKILFLAPGGQIGGAEHSLLDLIASLRSAREDWPLQLIAGGNGPLVSAAAGFGVSTQVIPLPRSVARLGDAGMGGPAGRQVGCAQVLAGACKAIPRAMNYVSRLGSAIRDGSPDIVHSNGFKMHVLAARAIPSSVPLLWNVRDYVGARPIMSRLLRAHAKRCSAAITNSNSVADDLRVACGSGLHRIYTVHNAIDLERFSPQGPTLDLDRLAGMPPAPNGTVRVGLVATMARWKGQEVFLKALSMLPRTVSPFRAYVVGGPIYQTAGSQYQIDELQQLTKQLGISQLVGFPGFVSDSAAAIRALDVVVHASTQPEPFGRVIAEGMACGRAVVASAGGGAREIISEGVNALAHPPGDAIALTRCLATLIPNRGLRARLGKAGRDTTERRFDRTLLASRFVPIYREIASRPPV